MRVPSLGKWFGRSVWSLLDQGLFALSNFALNVLLARWLGESDYGAFSVAFTVFLFLGVIYSSLMVEPMLVFGPGRYEGAFQAYLKVLGAIHWRIAALATTGIGAVCAAFYLGGPVFSSLLVLSLVSGLIFQQWLLRRACYVRLEPRVAAIGGIIYLTVMLGGAAGLRQSGQLSAVNGILLMAVASLFASLWIRRRLGANGVDSCEGPGRAAVVRDHWAYGKWAVATGVLSWFPGNIYMLLLPVWKGEEASGALRASFNLALPMLQVVASAGTMLLPVFVRARNEPDFARTLQRVLLLLGVPALAYVGMVVLFGKWFFQMLYDGAYEEHAGMAWVVVLSVVPGTVVMVLGAALRAMEASSKVFIAYVGASLACIVAGLPLTAKYGVAGAAAGMVLASLTTAVVMGFQLRRALRTPLPDAATVANSS
ncbi:polysaccharide biosynthesis C-terminal domain-containing protein [Luteolibacter marinus]|uniref:polysaccharide biosynthesis C-terminal domain-containing protein n=1 Tax=Luteolibacter marinus TaxID=2776705 RepID=UPI001868F92A|nr:polysaccharide biosynthesis C-terminal domain-containing protein [Luteolibacter marinus]